MPLLYQGVCSSCDYRTPVMSGGYNAVFVDRPLEESQPDATGRARATAAGAKVAKADDDRRFVVLAHPLEERILAETGYTKSDLFWQGRFVAVTNVICRRCGRVFQTRRLEAPGGVGCTTALVIGLAIGIAAGIATHSFVVGFVCWYVASFLAAIGAARLAGWYVRRRFAERAAALAAERCCPACNADDSLDIYRARRARCPKCRQPELSFKSVGRS